MLLLSKKGKDAFKLIKKMNGLERDAIKMMRVCTNCHKINMLN